VELVSIDDIRHAAAGLAGVVVRTPLVPASWAGKDLWVKPENLQPIGSFKLRGGYNAVAALPPERRAAGIIAHSSGNHGQAVAYAARAFGVPCVVVMPDAAEPVKIEAVEALGARVVLVPPAERIPATAELAAKHGYSVIPPFDSRVVIAGQGTVGLEIVADMSDVDVVLVPVGGGGLASGVATAVKALRPSAAVFGVEPALAADARDSLAAGRVVTWPTEQAYRTTADGLRTHISELTLAHLSARLDGIVTVSEDEILSAVGLLARFGRLVVEPSGAASVAAYLHRRAELPAGRTVAILSGGNLDPALLAKLLIG
jgi:threonine dehydratase